MKAPWRAVGLVLAGVVLGFALGFAARVRWPGADGLGDRTDRTDRTDLSDPSDRSDPPDREGPPSVAAGRGGRQGELTPQVPALGLDRARVRRLVNDYQRVPDPAARLALVARLFENWARAEPEAAAVCRGPGWRPTRDLRGIRRGT